MEKENITIKNPVTEPSDTVNTVAKKKKKHKELKSFIAQIGIIGAIIAIALIFFFNFKIIHSNNMYPFIQDGELVLISKFTEPINESVVLYETPDGFDQLGRIMAFAENEVTVSEDGGISVDGRITYQTVPYVTPLGSLEYPYTIPANCVFIVNDYREDISDSRTYGAIPIQNIKGVVIFAMQYRGF